MLHGAVGMWCTGQLLLVRLRTNQAVVLLLIGERLHVSQCDWLSLLLLHLACRFAGVQIISLRGGPLGHAHKIGFVRGSI